MKYHHIKIIPTDCKFQAFWSKNDTKPSSFSEYYFNPRLEIQVAVAVAVMRCFPPALERIRFCEC